MLYLPDTNVFSRHLSGKDPGLSAKLIENRPLVRLSPIVISELFYGAARRPDRPEYRDRTIELCAQFTTAELDAEDAPFYGFVRAHLEMLKPNAQPIGANDLFLAAQALRLDAILVTNNTREFMRVPQLKLENWQTLPSRSIGPPAAPE
jgi:tRNA(fMet)-specific endonuclease VapC